MNLIMDRTISNRILILLFDISLSWGKSRGVYVRLYHFHKIIPKFPLRYTPFQSNQRTSKNFPSNGPVCSGHPIEDVWSRYHHHRIFSMPLALHPISKTKKEEKINIRQEKKIKYVDQSKIYLHEACKALLWKRISSRRDPHTLNPYT